eukprot:4317151-Pyramimonas_sp.AAC.1
MCKAAVQEWPSPAADEECSHGRRTARLVVQQGPRPLPLTLCRACRGGGLLASTRARHPD